jgi:hypothetical protein
MDISANGKRKMRVSTFKGRKLVHLREYYEKDGEMLPGKKGIALDEVQLEAVREAFTSGALDWALANVEAGGGAPAAKKAKQTKK